MTPLGSGARLGTYEIVDAIGAGGMGVVYRALDTHLHRTVALKVLIEESSGLGAMTPAFSPDGRELAYSRSEVDGSWHVWTTGLEGGSPRQLTRSDLGSCTRVGLRSQPADRDCGAGWLAKGATASH